MYISIYLELHSHSFFIFPAWRREARDNENASGTSWIEFNLSSYFPPIHDDDDNDDDVDDHVDDDIPKSSWQKEMVRRRKKSTWRMKKNTETSTYTDNFLRGLRTDCTEIAWKFIVQNFCPLFFVRPIHQVRNFFSQWNIFWNLDSQLSMKIHTCIIFHVENHIDFADLDYGDNVTVYKNIKMQKYKDIKI